MIRQNMILNLERNTDQNDIEISIKYPVLNTSLERIISFIKTVDTQIECNSNNSIKLVNISDIYYIESENKTTVIFCENKKIQSGFRLYQLNEKLKDKGFCQISKYCIININKLVEINPLFNSRTEAVMTNGVRLYISRRYLKNIKRKLQNEG